MKEYYLIFQNSKSKKWWNLFTTDNFEHCDVLQYDTNTYMLTCISGYYNAFNIENGYITDIDKHLHKLKSYGILILKVKKIEKQKLFMIGTCVGICKKVLGITNPFIITPYQLYKYGRNKWQTVV